MSRRDVASIADSLELPPAPGSFTGEALAGLPPAARRYLAAAIGDGTPLVRAARIRMHGEIRLGSRWFRFTGDEVLAPELGFLWTARTRIGVSGSDHYAAGTGGMNWKLLGLVPVMRAEGPDVSRSARGRAAGEAIWVPTTLLPSAGVTWEAGPDESRASARLRTDGHETVLDLVVDADGSARSVAFDRWGDPDETGSFAVHRFGMDATEHATFGGLTVPSVGLAGWHHGTDRWPDSAFFRYRITELSPV